MNTLVEPMYVHNVKEAVLEIVTAVENETLPLEMTIPSNVVPKSFIAQVQFALKAKRIRITLAQANTSKGNRIYAKRGEG